MTIERRFAVRFGSYIKHLVKIVLASSLALGLVLGVSIFLSGETSMNLTVDFDAVDGVWVILGLPVLSVLVFSLLSPLSFFIHKLLSKRTPENVLRDA
jgi:hypothetical protein